MASGDLYTPSYDESNWDTISVASCFELGQIGIPADTKLTFVDFIPGITPGGDMRSCYKGSIGVLLGKKEMRQVFCPRDAEYEPFSNALELANEWLEENNQWEVINCETVDHHFGYNRMKHETHQNAPYYELMINDALFDFPPNDTPTLLKGIRIWVCPRRKCKDLIKISYMDFVPEEFEEFEDLDTIIAKINGAIRNGELTGRIISVDTFKTDATTSWKVDLEKSKQCLASVRCVLVIRVWIEQSSMGQFEEIDIIDFVPDEVSQAGFFKGPQYQSFTHILKRASIWLAENPEFSLKNAQTLELKLKTDEPNWNRKLRCNEQGDIIRILRIVYAKPRPSTPKELLEGNQSGPPPPPPAYLTSKFFETAKKGDKVLSTWRYLKALMNEWTNDYFARKSSDGETSRRLKKSILSAETVRFYSRKMSITSPNLFEKTFERVLTSRASIYYSCGIRVYYDIGNLEDFSATL